MKHMILNVENILIKSEKFVSENSFPVSLSHWSFTRQSQRIFVCVC